MGYNTDFTGHVDISPPLNGPEMAYLRRFASSRRYQCSEGPYHVSTDGDPNRHDGCSPISINIEPTGQPGLWCEWEPTEDGTGIEWNGAEKFYDAAEWMRYLINAFLRDRAAAKFSDDPQFRHFTFDHVVNGRIEAQGDDPDDRWTLVVVDNTVSKVKMPTIAERMDTDATLQAAFQALRDAGVTAEQYARQIGEDR
jgi:hypothetical protein